MNIRCLVKRSGTWGAALPIPGFYDANAPVHLDAAAADLRVHCENEESIRRCCGAAWLFQQRCASGPAPNHKVAVEATCAGNPGCLTAAGNCGGAGGFEVAPNQSQTPGGCLLEPVPLIQSAR
jgi:hypothetical protein